MVIVDFYNLLEIGFLDLVFGVGVAGNKINNKRPRLFFLSLLQSVAHSKEI